MLNYPSTESRILIDLNDSNENVVIPTYLTVDNFKVTNKVATCDITGDTNYRGTVNVTYTRWDIATYFKNVPVVVDGTLLKSQFTGADLRNILNDMWYNLFVDGDLTTTWLNYRFRRNDYTGGTMRISMAASSPTWTGQLVVRIGTPKKVVDDIWKVKPIIEQETPTASHVNIFFTDYTRYQALLKALTSSSTKDDLSDLLNMFGWIESNINAASFIYNGPVDKIPSPLTGTACTLYENVLILKANPNSGASYDYLHYGRIK